MKDLLIHFTKAGPEKNRDNYWPENKCQISLMDIIRSEAAATATRVHIHWKSQMRKILVLKNKSDKRFTNFK